MLLKDIQWQVIPNYEGVWTTGAYFHLPDGTTLLIYRLDRTKSLSRDMSDYNVRIVNHHYTRKGKIDQHGWNKHVDALELQCLLFHYLNPLPEEVT